MTIPTETNSKALIYTVYFLKPKLSSEELDWIKARIASEHGDKNRLNQSIMILARMFRLLSAETSLKLNNPDSRIA